MTLRLVEPGERATTDEEDLKTAVAVLNRLVPSPLLRKSESHYVEAVADLLAAVQAHEEPRKSR